MKFGFGQQHTQNKDLALNKREQNTGVIISFGAITLLLIYLSLSILGFNSEIQFFYTLAITFLCSLCLCIFFLRKYRKNGVPTMIDYLNIGTQRYILAILMVFYGVDKIFGNFFDYQLFALDSKLGEVSEFQLAWFFYGKNHWQEFFIGVMEFVPGLLLLYRRTYYIAALILLPVTAQVFLLNLFFKIGGITFPAAIILLACNLYILYSQKEKIILFLRTLDFNIVRPITGKTKIAISIFKGIGFFLVFIIILLKLKSTFFESSYQKKYQTLVGGYTLKEIKKNGSAYMSKGDRPYYKDLYIEKQSRWNLLRRFDGTMDAFILKINTHNDSMALYVNKGGIGDDPAIIDSTTVLKGVYKLEANNLTIQGIQLKDTLQLTYEKQAWLKPKKWFW